MLSQAKDFQDIIRIQTEFMQMQFSVFAEQTKSLTEAMLQGRQAMTVSKLLIGFSFVLYVFAFLGQSTNPLLADSTIVP